MWVHDDAERFGADAQDIWYYRDLANLSVLGCEDGNCVGPSSDFTWSIEAAAPFSASDFSDSGSGDTVSIQVREERPYTLTCDNRAGYTNDTPTVQVFTDSSLTVAQCEYTTL